jgi:hypothetical protein
MLFYKYNDMIKKNKIFMILMNRILQFMSSKFSWKQEIQRQLMVIQSQES